MIVSKFRDPAHARTVGIKLAELFKLVPDVDGRYETSMGIKTAEGLARGLERIYREAVYGIETVADDERYYAANISGEDPQWPKPVDDFPV